MSRLFISGTNTRDHRVLPGGLVHMGPTERALPMAAAHRIFAASTCADRRRQKQRIQCFDCPLVLERSAPIVLACGTHRIRCATQKWPEAPAWRLEPCWAEVTLSDHGWRWRFAAEIGGATSALSTPSLSWGSHMPWLAGARPSPSPSKTSTWLLGRWSPWKKPRGEWLHLPSSCPRQPHGCCLRCCVWRLETNPQYLALTCCMLAGWAQPWELLQPGYHPDGGLRRADHPAVSPSQCRRSISFAAGPPNPLVHWAPLLRHVATFTAYLLIQTTMVIVLPIDWQQNHGKGSLTHVTRCYDPKIIRGKNLWEGSAESAWRTTRLLWDFKIN